MKNENWTIKGRIKTRITKRLKALIKCLHSGEQSKSNEMISSSESLATRDYSASVHSTRGVDAEQEPDTGKIEEAELSLRENGSLNYEVFIYQIFAPTALNYHLILFNFFPCLGPLFFHMIRVLFLIFHDVLNNHPCMFFRKQELC